MHLRASTGGQTRGTPCTACPSLRGARSNPACSQEAALETHELPPLPLPPHLEEEEAEAEAARKQWVRLKASLLRDSKGQFRISLLEDRGGIHLNRIERSDVHDDREKLLPHDYLVTINRKSADEMSLAGVKEVIKHAGSILELEVRVALT